MNKKYELTNETITFHKRTLYLIKALRSFSDVKEGDLGGYVESESNLSQHGNCWVYDKAKVFDNAIVRHNATVRMNAQVYDNAHINENALILRNVSVCKHAIIGGYVTLTDNAMICGEAFINGNAFVGDSAYIDDKAHISGKAKIVKCTIVNGYAYIKGNAVIESMKDYLVFQDNWISGYPFTYTKSNKMWTNVEFHGTSEELLEYAYKQSKTSGKNYELYVNLVNRLVEYQTISHSDNKNELVRNLIDDDELQHFLTKIAYEEEDLILQENWIDNNDPVLNIQKEIYQQLKTKNEKMLFAKTAASQYALSQAQKTIGELVEQYGIIELNNYFKEYEIIE